jgi:hypothetical protein
MSKKLATIALTAALATATAIPSAYADRRGHDFRGDHGRHQAWNGGRDHHRGRGHWHNGKWIALGILGAAAAGAAYADDDCYRTRSGRVVCD